MSEIRSTDRLPPEIESVSLPQPGAAQPGGTNSNAVDSSSFEELTFQMGEQQARKKAVKPDSRAQHHAARRVSAADLRREYPTQRLRRMYQVANGFFSNDSIEEASDDLLRTLSDDEDGMENSAKFARDALSRYVVLRDALDKTDGKDGMEVVRGRIEAAIERLVQTDGGRVLVGINTPEALRNFSYKVDERDMLREAYYDSIVTGRSLLETFERLLSDFGSERIEETLVTMRSAIVEDMRSPIASIDRQRLFAYHRDLNKIVSIRSLIANLKGMAPMFPLLQQNKVLTRAVAKVMRYTYEASPQLFLDLCICMSYGENGDDDKEEQRRERILAITDLIRRQVDALLRRHIPDFLWPDQQARGKALDFSRAGAPAAGPT